MAEGGRGRGFGKEEEEIKRWMMRSQGYLSVADEVVSSKARVVG